MDIKKEYAEELRAISIHLSRLLHGQCSEITKDENDKSYHLNIRALDKEIVNLLNKIEAASSGIESLIVSPKDAKERTLNELWEITRIEMEASKAARLKGK